MGWGGKDFFSQGNCLFGCSYVVYQVSIFYYARNWLNSLLWWVVGGWLRPIIVLSLAQAEQLVSIDGADSKA